MSFWQHEGRARMGRPVPVVPVAGDLLVASILVRGDIFEQSVILVLDVDDHGSSGVILNRPSDTPVDELLDGWGQFASEPPLLSVGGPVSRDGALCVARLDWRDDNPAGWVRCHDDLGLLQLDTPTELVAGHYRDLRIFVGYAGWSPGQLEDEIEAGLWHVLPGRPEDPFDPDPEGLWRRVLRRSGGDLAWFATWTHDPKIN